MAQIVKSTHPATKSGGKYAVGGQVKKYADGGEVDNPVVVTSPLEVPIGKPVQAAGEAVGGELGGMKTRLMRGLEGAKSMFKSPEARAEEQKAKDAALIKKYSQ